MEDVLVPLLIFGAPARRRAEITERLLPAAIPGSVGERLAFAAVVAQQQISSREQTELEMVKEAAARFADADDLAKNAPTLHGIYAGLPEAVQETIEFNTGSPEQKRERERKRREALEAALKEQTMKEQRMKEPTLGRKA
jgi:hypothetical protein